MNNNNNNRTLSSSNYLFIDQINLISKENMKPLKAFIVLMMLVGIISCNDNNVIRNISVYRYTELLKANQYDSINLPAFTYDDIPALLTYRNDTQVITNFPHNGISSLYAPECKMGMYVLWTIESIRAVSINSEYLIMRFPSQNPILALRDSTGLQLVSDDASHEIAAKAYYDWWENNKGKNYNEFKNTDPLTGTAYKWH